MNDTLSKSMTLNVQNANKRISFDIEDRAKVLDKFKLIVDMMSIYKDPKILTIIKEYIDEKEQQRVREIERENIRQEIMLKHQQQNQNNKSDTFDNIFDISNFWNIKTNTDMNTHVDSSSDETEKSDMSEDLLDYDKVTNMLNIEYDNIINNSMIRRTYDIERRNYCQLDESEEEIEVTTNNVDNVDIGGVIDMDQNK